MVNFTGKCPVTGHYHNPWNALQVEQIKAEFKVLALRHHPDKSPGDEQSREAASHCC